MRADRLLAIVMLLQARGKLTTHALAEELAVSRRTILRDIDALSISGIPIYTEGGHGGGVALDENYRTSLTGLKADEIRSLFIAGNNQLLRDLGWEDAAESTRRKLSAALPSQHQPIVEHVRQRIYIDPTWWWHDQTPTPFWGILQQAVFEDRHLHTLYADRSGQAVERILAPYSLVAKGSLWYLVAARDGELRMYRVSRFQQMTLLDTHFERIADFDLPEYWQAHTQAFIETLAEYRCTLRIDPARLPFVQWLMPGRYEIEPEPDQVGWLIVHFQLESIELAKMMVFGLGGQAQVIAPDDLRESVIATAREILQS